MSVFNMSPFGSSKKKQVKRTTSVISYDSVSNFKGAEKKTANSFVISNQGSDSDDSNDLSYDDAPVTVDILDDTVEGTPNARSNLISAPTPAANKMQEQIALGLLTDLSSVNKKEQ